MNRWLENSKKNLTPRSVSTDFYEALAEWHFTGEVLDCDGANGGDCCELCEQQHLSQHYVIENPRTRSTLRVGSSCILKFPDIEVRDQLGTAVTDPSKRRSYLQAALRWQRVEKSLQPLRELWKKAPEHRDELKRVAMDLKQYGKLDPASLVWLFSRLQAADVVFDPTLYSVYLQSSLAAEQMERISASDFGRIKPALSRQQLNRYAHRFSSDTDPSSLTSCAPPAPDECRRRLVLPIPGG